MSDITFPEPMCFSCGAYENSYPDRLCYGKSKIKPRRFKNKDPKRKVPDWCPKRNDPAIVRVYRFKDEQSAIMHMMFESEIKTGENKSTYASPFTHHYMKASEHRINISAKSFYAAALEYEAVELIGLELEYGDVVEIDDGLKPYFFYFRGHQTFRPAWFRPPADAETKKTKKGEKRCLT